MGRKTIQIILILLLVQGVAFTDSAPKQKTADAGDSIASLESDEIVVYPDGGCAYNCVWWCGPEQGSVVEGTCSGSQYCCKNDDPPKTQCTYDCIKTWENCDGTVIPVEQGSCSDLQSICCNTGENDDDTDTDSDTDTDADTDSDTDTDFDADYALPPPSQCHAYWYVPDCVHGDPDSECGGICVTVNVCSEDQDSNQNAQDADTTFICPRFMLYSPEMMQAAIDDGLEEFNYAVVGHDADTGFIDGDDTSTCCQCYQMIYAYPSPYNDRQVLADPNDSNNPVSAVPIPKPLIVQSFNTAATRNTFDVYMAGGGFGAHNGCGPGLAQTSVSGEYLYTFYPEEGGWSGGVKPATHWSECKTDINWVTEASLSSAECQTLVEETCNEITHSDPNITAYARNSCIQSNQPESLYHLNWSVYVRKVECPEHLTQVTGCKLAPQGLPEATDAITTAAQAAKNGSFWTQSSNGRMYETTTMEDCCRPSCASNEWLSQHGLETQGDYNVFYSCDKKGIPYTE